MLTRLLQWNRQRRQWNRDHAAAWAGQNVPGASGLSLFQERCEAEVAALLQSRGLTLKGRVVKGDLERYLHAHLADTPWEVWIYTDQAQLSGPGNATVNLEQWDARTPDELIHTFLVHVSRSLDEVGV